MPRGCIFPRTTRVHFHRTTRRTRHRKRPAAPARATAPCGLSRTARVAPTTPLDTCGKALQVLHPGVPRRGSSTIAGTRACARPRSRAGSVIEPSVSKAKKRSGGRSFDVGETRPANENARVSAAADEGRAYGGHDACLDGPQ